MKQQISRTVDSIGRPAERPAGTDGKESESSAMAHFMNIDFAPAPKLGPDGKLVGIGPSLDGRIRL
jgi:hypothetical protein